VEVENTALLKKNNVSELQHHEERRNYFEEFRWARQSSFAMYHPSYTGGLTSIERDGDLPARQ
jgi:hypothetical protein